MSLKTINPTTTEAWKTLQKLFLKTKQKTIKQLFAEDNQRAKNFSIDWQDFHIDYSKNIIDKNVWNALISLAEQVDLKDGIAKQFSGSIINQTEKRAVLHTALRASAERDIKINDLSISSEIETTKQRLKHFTQSVISGEKKGFTGKGFTDIVNIGIGGSDLGPVMVIEALKYYKNHLNVHFVSNVEGDHVYQVIKDLNPETTLFVIVSKSFTTQETLANALTIQKWFLQYAETKDIEKHFIAVSTNLEKIKEFGINLENVFPMWNWVGGRFSLWSAVGISISLAIGYEHFENLLEGAREMDEHFINTPFTENIPVVLALMGIWYNNFFGTESEAVIPYTQYLSRFPAYLQQADMESNGKSIDRNGQKVNYQTGTIIWGEPGTNAQHAFFQLIHQGTKLIPVDFIAFKESLFGNKEHQDKLIANVIAQSEALMKGKTHEQVTKELTHLPQSEAEKIQPFKIFEGNKPTNTIFIKKLTPRNIGALIAFYEHKIFVQGYIWNIFSYDQWGVELGKQLANDILKDISKKNISKHDASTEELIRRYKC